MFDNFLCHVQKCQYISQKQDIYFLTSYISVSSKPAKTISSNYIPVARHTFFIYFKFLLFFVFLLFCFLHQSSS